MSLSVVDPVRMLANSLDGKASPQSGMGASAPDLAPQDQAPQDQAPQDLAPHDLGPEEQASAIAALQDIFVGFLIGHPYYRQIRLIGIADQGRELVRVDRQGDEVVPVQGSALQVKGDRPYFQQASALPPGEFYLSSIELNREHGVIEVPHWPTLRGAFPIYSDGGRLYGIVVINVDVSAALDQVREGVSDFTNAYLIDPQGNFLVHPKRDLEFGKDFGRDVSWNTEFPSTPLATLMNYSRNSLQSDHYGGWIVKDDKAKTYLAAQNFFYNQDNMSDYVTLIYSIKHENIKNLYGDRINNTVLMVTVVGIVIGIIVLFFLRWALRPLEQLSQAADGLGKGKWDTPISPSHFTEIKALASAFRRMIGQLKNRNQIPVMIHAIDASGRITRANTTWLRTLGYDEAEVIGRPWLTFIAPTPSDLVIPQPTQACTGVSLQVIAKDGSLRDVAMSMIPDNGGGGPAVETMVVLVDMTVQVQLKKEIRRSNERFRRAFESAGHGVALVTVNGQWMEVNDRLCESLGCSRRQVFAADFMVFLYPGDRATFDHQMQALLTGLHDTILCELRFRRCDGSILPTMMAGGLVRDVDGEDDYFVFQITDISALKDAESRVVQIQKMEAIGNLTGGIAHDFNNLLGVILGNLQLMRRRLPTDPKLEKFADSAIAATERGASLTRQLLAFSRRQVLEPQIVDANALIREVTKILSRTLGPRYPIHLRLQDPLPAVRVDPAQLEAAILNLAINSRDAMPGGGEITLSTRLRNLDESYVETVKDARLGLHVCLSVADRGEGMPAAVKDKVFEPFFTTKDPGKGTGLGLSMVHGFVHQSGGHVTLYSEIGSGTIVALYLPALNDVMAQTSTQAEPAALAARRGRVLVVDDEPAFAEVIAQQLIAFGYQVSVAYEPAKALALLAQGETFDLVISDLVMPGPLNGQQLADRIRVQFPALPILLTSGFPKDALDDGQYYPLLQKPFTEKELLEALDRTMTSPVSDGFSEPKDP